MKPVVVFIDDEPNILRGLKRLLRTQRDKWDMVFIEGGQQALDWLEREHVDVIVTDMRMPGVDGAHVLEYAAVRGKGRVRLVLSGEADRDMTRRTVGRSHQFFAKPCNERHLVQTIEGALSLGADLLPPKLQQHVANVSTLPGAAETHDALEKAFSDSDMGRLSHVVASDPALALRVLQLANSSYFGRPTDTLSIAAAVRSVSLDVMKSLWQRGNLLAGAEDDEMEARLHQIRMNAVDTGRGFFAISADNGATDSECEDSYAVGLLSWVGEVMTCVSGETAKRDLQASGPLAAASYAVCLYGLPFRISQVFENLARSGSQVETSHGRADALGAVRFEKEAAF